MILFDMIKNLIKPKFIRMGYCKKCGICCKNITISTGHGKYISTVEEFELLKFKEPRYKHFFITKKENGILNFTCKSLKEDNTCKDYHFRALFCRLYPRFKSRHIAAGLQTLDGCGYYYKSAVEFEDFLK